MANTHIELVGSESRLAGKFRNLVDRVQSDKSEMAYMKSIMDKMGASVGEFN